MCGCKKGYELGSDQKTCYDVNECKQKSSCKFYEKCVNVPGSYKCIIATSDRSSCTANYYGQVDQCCKPEEGILFFQLKLAHQKTDAEKHRNDRF